ncbi:hypothetical protein D3C71_1207460 [compost metagenome]
MEIAIVEILLQIGPCLIKHLIELFLKIPIEFKTHCDRIKLIQIKIIFLNCSSTQHKVLACRLYKLPHASICDFLAFGWCK